MIIENKNLRYILILFIFGMIYALLFEILPKGVSVLELGYTYASQISSINSKDKLAGSIKELELANRQLKKKISSGNGNDGNIYSRIRFLDSLAERNNVRISNIKPGDNISENNLNYIPVDISFLASYKACFTFLRDFENSGRPVSIKGLKLLNKEKNDLLEMTISLRFYINES